MAMSAEESGQKFSMPVTHGSVTVRVNRITKPDGYEYYQVRYYPDGKRKTKTFSNLAEAEKWAKSMAKKLHEGDGHVIHLKGGDRLAYLQAVAALRPTKVSLESAATEYRLAHDLLGGKASVLEAVRCFAEEKIETVTPKTVPEILKELLEVREKERVSKVHLKDIGNRLGRFATKFTGLLSTVSASEIHDFLLALAVEPRTQNNFRMAISNLVGFPTTDGSGHRSSMDDERTKMSGTGNSGAPAPQVGDTVKYSKPADEEERDFRFVLLELNGDRASIQLQCDWRIKPVETVPLSEIAKA